MKLTKEDILRNLLDKNHITLQEMVTLLADEPSKYAIPLTDEQIKQINVTKMLIIN